MKKRFLEHLNKENLIMSGSRVVVSVSGGPDSVALLTLLFEVQKALQLKLYVAHINYHLRGSDSNKDEALVKELAQKLNLEFFLNSVHPKNKDEASLREIRHTYLEKIRQQKKASLIALGHTLDDQIETFLMFLLRGSGIQGLSAIQSRNKHLVRPLLLISKPELVAYLKAKKQSFCLDRSNSQNNYTRNRIRNRLLPYLEKNYNPSLKKTLSQTVHLLDSDFTYLKKTAQRSLQALLVKKTSSFIDLDAQKWARLDPALKRHVLRQTIFEFQGHLQNLSAKNLQYALNYLEKPSQKQAFSLSQGLHLTKRRARIRLSFSN
ncbi:tRNA lysidine(34) synthetase TilS [Patescibacteria group bacterium]|nr:tRNA lysidine(34) synthetase TilS [Patescibacteria group bacterium]